MTYVIGFKAANSSFLIADSAVTTREPITDYEVSSFGERYVVESNRAVAESALKIFNLGRVALSGAGRKELLVTVVNSCRQWLDLQIEPAEAFHRAIDGVTPLSAPDALQAVIVWRDDTGTARLYSFNAAGDQTIVEHDDLVQLGSIDENHKNLTRTMVEALQTDKERDAQQRCAIAVSLCQSYGIHYLLMESGIGGVFYGAYTSHDGEISWNADLSYLTYDGSVEGSWGPATYTYFRENVLVGVSTIPPKTQSTENFRFRRTILANDTDDMQRAKLLSDEVLDCVMAGIPDYLTCLDKSAPRVTTFELLGQSQHQSVIVEKLDVAAGVRRIMYRDEWKEPLYRASTANGRRPFTFVKASPVDDPNELAKARNLRQSKM